MNRLPYAKKSLGQHWLTDEPTLRVVMKAAIIGDEDTVLEIGPGLGTLTKLLVVQAKEVIAVEFDTELAAQLPVAVPAANLTVVHQDILSFDLTSLPSGYKVVANIPYYLTSNLLRTLCESSNPPAKMALLVQKEVAERVAAGPGAMSLLSVSVQFYCDVSLGRVVPKQLFTPPPKVDSQILQLAYRGPRFTDVNTKLFFQIVKAGFAARRKTLENSLAGGLRLDKAVVTEQLQAAGLDPKVRAQNLVLEQWYALYMIIAPLLSAANT